MPTVHWLTMRKPKLMVQPRQTCLCSHCPFDCCLHCHCRRQNNGSTSIQHWTREDGEDRYQLSRWAYTTMEHCANIAGETGGHKWYIETHGTTVCGSNHKKRLSKMFWLSIIENIIIGKLLFSIFGNLQKCAKFVFEWNCTTLWFWLGFPVPSSRIYQCSNRAVHWWTSKGTIKIVCMQSTQLTPYRASKHCTFPLSTCAFSSPCPVHREAFVPGEREPLSADHRASEHGRRWTRMRCCSGTRVWWAWMNHWGGGVCLVRDYSSPLAVSAGHSVALVWFPITQLVKGCSHTNSMDCEQFML